MDSIKVAIANKCSQWEYSAATQLPELKIAIREFLEAHDYEVVQAINHAKDDEVHIVTGIDPALVDNISIRDMLKFEREMAAELGFRIHARKNINGLVRLTIDVDNIHNLNRH